MKRVLLTSSILMIVMSGFCQTTKGTFFVNASSDFNFNSSNLEIKSNALMGNNTTDQTSLSLNPQVGFFFIDNLVGGINFGLDFEKSETQFITIESTTLTIGPFARYYFSGDSFRPFAEGSFIVGTIKTDGESDPVSGFQIALGGAYFIKDFISIDIGVGYARATIKDELILFDTFGGTTVTEGIKFITTGIGVFAGFSFYL